MRTSALATSAPLGSCTVPAIAPVAPPCAKTCTASANAMRLKPMNLIEELAMIFLPHYQMLEFRFFYCSVLDGRHRQQRDEFGVARTCAGRFRARLPGKNSSSFAIALWIQLSL